MVVGLVHTLIFGEFLREFEGKYPMHGMVMNRSNHRITCLAWRFGPRHGTLRSYGLRKKEHMHFAIP